MKILRITQILGLASLMLLFVQCDDEIYLPDQETAAKSSKAVKAPSEETAGNNLSYPVLWADGFGKELRGSMDSSTLEGEWWYVWGLDPIDPQADIFSCQPSPNNSVLCLDGTPPGDGISEVYRAYVQKDVNNEWQAFNAVPVDKVDVDWIDWGDDLESVDFSINSMVRAEVVLYEGLLGKTFKDYSEVPVDLMDDPQYPMRHVSGWGSNEVHGLQTFNEAGDPAPVYSEAPGDMATVYSHHARFTIQKLNVNNLDDLDGKLQWVAKEGWIGTPSNEGLINPYLFNMAVYEADDGPGFYNAEINVKGKVIYGYTWNVKNLNEGEGYYRLTFSLDADNDGRTTLNTFFGASTDWIENLAAAKTSFKSDGETESEEEGGGVKEIDVDNQLTYMDIYITSKRGGGKGGNGGNTGNGGDTGNGVPGGGKGGRK